MKQINLLAIALFFSIQATAQTKTENIVELLEVSGVKQNLRPMMRQMIAMIKTGSEFDEVPNEYWEEVTSEQNVNKMIELYIPIYDKHYTEKEIKDMIAFYKTETGRSMVKKMPALLQESMGVGQKWGIQIAEEVLEKMNKN